MDNKELLKEFGSYLEQTSKEEYVPDVHAMEMDLRLPENGRGS